MEVSYDLKPHLIQFKYLGKDIFINSQLGSYSITYHHRISYQDSFDKYNFNNFLLRDSYDLNSPQIYYPPIELALTPICKVRITESTSCAYELWFGSYLRNFQGVITNVKIAANVRQSFNFRKVFL